MGNCGSYIVLSKRVGPTKPHHTHTFGKQKIEQKTADTQRAASCFQAVQINL